MPIKFNYTKHFVGLSLGFSGFFIPVPFIKNIDFTNFWLIIVFSTVMIERLLKIPFQMSKSNWLYRLMIIVFIAIVFRIISNPPGFGGSGGIINTSLLLMSIFNFFIFRNLINGISDFNQELKIGGIVCFIFLLIQILFNMKSPGDFYIGYLYHYQMWFIASIVLSYFMSKSCLKNNYRNFIIFSIIFLILSAFTPHRSRPIFAILNILIIIVIYKKKMLIIRYLFLLLILIFTNYFSGINLNILLSRRSMSVINELTGLKFLNYYVSGGEIGLESNVRVLLYNKAIVEIIERPLFGRGYAINQQEIAISQYLKSNRNIEGSIIDLAAGGAFHNFLLMLAVCNGLPVAILLAFIIIQQSFKFLIWIRKLPNSDLKLFCSAIYGFFLQMFGQGLVNGGMPELVVLLMILGMMNGLVFHNSRRENENCNSRTSSYISPKTLYSKL